MRQGLKNRVQFNPSDPPRMSVFKTDYLTRQSFNKRVGNANCAPNGECSNSRDASGIYVGPNQQRQQTQRQYYAPFRQPVKGYRKTLHGNLDSTTTWSNKTRNCLSTTEIYKDTYALLDPNNTNCTANGTISTSTIPITSLGGATKTYSGNYSRTNKPLIRSGMQPNVAGKQNSGLPGTSKPAIRYSYSYRELINNRRKDTQIKKLATEKPASSTNYWSNPQTVAGYGGDCCGSAGGGPVRYRYNNPKFAVQGAVEASDRITRLKMDTIKGAIRCPPGQTTTYSERCNGVYSVGNLQTSRTKSWPAGTSSYTKVKYVSKFNNNHDEVNYPQVSALARVRGSSGNKRRNTGEIIEYGGNTCAKSCRPQLLM